MTDLFITLGIGLFIVPVGLTNATRSNGRDTGPR